MWDKQRLVSSQVGQEEVQEALNPEMDKVREERGQVLCWAVPSAIGMCLSLSSQLLSKKCDSSKTYSTFTKMEGSWSHVQTREFRC